MNALYNSIIAIVNLCYKTDRWLMLLDCRGENDWSNNLDVIRPRHCSSDDVLGSSIAYLLKHELITRY